MTDQREIWVFSEKPSLLPELVNGAGDLATLTGANVVALVVGSQDQAQQTSTLGVQRVFWLGETPDQALFEDCVVSIAELAIKHNPYALLIASTTRGRAVAGRLAARLDVSVLTDVKEINLESGSLQIRHMIFGGGAVRIEKPSVEPVIMTVTPGTFTPTQADSTHQVEIVSITREEPAWQMTVQERKTRAAAMVNLAAAKKVVCPGRGVARQEDLALIEELARELGAEIGCTRPLAEGLDWLPRERYIGISGANIKPDLYLGVGVSGQVQHTVGMSESRVVVAINKDKEAPLFAQADYGIVGDLYTIVPALIAAIKARK
jgi:electron transfer flavoprotein alpha subunit